MDDGDKLQRLRALSEGELRTQVLMPLLGRMGFLAVCEYHGSREHGKDIVCFEMDRLHEKRYLALVAKTSDLSGSVSSSNGLMEVLNQTEQCFNENYHDVFGMRAVTMNEVWIVTSGRVVPGAADSVFGRLRKSNLDKLTRIIGGEQLIALVDKYFPTYWNRAIESPEYVRAQRDRYRLFVHNLLAKLGASTQQTKEVLAALDNSDRPPHVYINDFALYALRRGSAHSIDVDTTGATYPIGMVGDECGNIQRGFRRAREAVRYQLQEIEETLINAERVLGATDPHEFIKAYDKYLRNDYPFWRHGRSDAPDEVIYLESGLQDADEYLRRIDAAGKRQEVTAYMAAIEAHEAAVAQYIVGMEVEEFVLAWELSGECVSLHYDGTLPENSEGFTTHHAQKIQRYDKWGSRIETITAADIIEAAQVGLREYLEPRLPGAAN